MLTKSITKIITARITIKVVKYIELKDEPYSVSRDLPVINAIDIPEPAKKANKEYKEQKTSSIIEKTKSIIKPAFGDAFGFLLLHLIYMYK